MTKHKAGTKFEREYKDKKVVVKVMADGRYQYNGKKFKSLSAAVNKGVGTTTPASVFFKTSGKSAAKTARKTRKGKAAPVEQAHSLSDMIREMVKKEIGTVQDTIREEVRSAVNGAISEGFRGEFN